MTLDTLPSLREIVDQHQLMARKSLGQHFLLDMNLTRRIVREAGDMTGLHVIEVGPGPGGLTRALLETQARHVTAIERDVRFVDVLQDVVKAADGRLTIIPADALGVDYRALEPAPRAIVANLPYNVGTPLLLGWLRQMMDFISLTLMFQREVAERLVATPGTKTYGRLSVMCQWRTEAKTLFHISPKAFVPPPKVESTVVQFVPRLRPPDDPEWSVMEKVVATAFNQRRKMLRASLRVLTPEAEDLIVQAGLSPTARAEEINVEGFVRLAKIYQLSPRTSSGVQCRMSMRHKT